MIVNSHVTFTNVLTMWIFYFIFIVFMSSLHYRNPYDRLVSAYKDKALRNDPGIGIYTKHYKSPCKWQTDQSPLLTFNQVCVLAGGSPGPKTPIEISCKIGALGYTLYCTYTLLFHNQGGYYNSLILQALELPPQTNSNKLHVEIIFINCTY